MPATGRSPLSQIKQLWNKSSSQSYTTHSTCTAGTRTVSLSDGAHIVCDCRVSAEVDIAIFIPENVDQDTLQQVRDSGEFLFLPAYLAAFSWIFNPEVAPGISLAGRKLRMDLQTIGLIWYSCILYLNDPRIIAQNEWLLPLLGDMTSHPVPIQSIVGCGSTVATAPIAASLNNLIEQYLASNEDAELSSCMTNFSKPTTNVVGGVTSWAEAADECMSVLHTRPAAVCVLARASDSRFFLAPCLAVDVCRRADRSRKCSLSTRRVSCPFRRWCWAR